MKKFLFLISAITVASGCSSKNSAEMLQVRSLSNTDNCQFVTSQYQETAPFNTVKYLQRNTILYGGDSYKIISSTPLSIISSNDAVGTNFEIYKCR